MTETQALTIQRTGTATVFKRLLMGKATQRTREAYADDLRAFAQFLQIEPRGDEHPLFTVPDEAWADLDVAAPSE